MGVVVVLLLIIVPTVFAIGVYNAEQRAEGEAERRRSDA